MFPCIEPQDNSSELQPHRHRLTLRGTPASIRFPPLCANCGAAAAGTVDVSKVFRQCEVEGPTRYTVTTAAVPFCSACTVAHRAQEVRPAMVDNVFSSFVGMNMLGAVFPGLGAAFLAWIALGDLLHGRGTRALVELGLGACFALVAWGAGRAIWRENERFRVPRQTEIAKAFDFSGDVAPALESARFVCALRNDAFAAAFESLNRDRAWDASSPAAVAERERSNRLMWIFGGVIAVVALWSLAKDFFG